MYIYINGQKQIFTIISFSEFKHDARHYQGCDCKFSTKGMDI